MTPSLKSDRIRNPLVGVPKAELLADVEQFATDNNLMDILPLLKKGALLAQNPRDLDKIDGLEDSERADILMEVTHRWRHPKTLYFTIILNSIAAAIQGWDQTGELHSIKHNAMQELAFSQVSRMKHELQIQDSCLLRLFWPFWRFQPRRIHSLTFPIVRNLD